MYKPLKKVPNWRNAIIEALTPFNTKKFEYGVADCYIIADAAFKAATGRRLYPGVKYRTLPTALRRMKKLGFNNLREALEKHPHLKKLRHSSQASRGDLGVIKIDGVWTIVVCDGPRFVGMGEFGFMQVPLSMVKSVYRI